MELGELGAEPRLRKNLDAKGADCKVDTGMDCPLVQTSFGPSEIRACETSNGISLPCTASNCKHCEAEVSSILNGITRKVPGFVNNAYNGSQLRTDCKGREVMQVKSSKNICNNQT